MQSEIEQRYRLAVQHHVAGKFGEAEAFYRQVLAKAAGHADAMHGLAVVMLQQHRFADAAEWLARVVTLQPENAEARSNYGHALRGAGRLDEALAACRQAVALKTDDAGAHAILAGVLREIGRFPEAIAEYRTAATLQPRNAEVLSNLGLTLMENGEFDEAIRACRRAVDVAPSYADAHGHLALALLSRGDLLEGFREYEWRWRTRNFPSPRRDFPQPMWDGSPLESRRILLHAEQGFGDCIQFARYVPLVRGGEVIVECQPELLRLLKHSLDGCTVIARGDKLPPFDVHCPLLTLPHIFQATLDTIPREVPYLRPDPQLVTQWRSRIGNLPVKKIGLAWSGQKRQENNRNRSMGAAPLDQLRNIANVQFFSLQKGGEPAPHWMTDLMPHVRDFADTASLLANLDLVITVDTSVAHLAGALGIPLWTLLSQSCDWRYLRTGERCPWYPSMRLFRQKNLGDWNGLMDEVAADLRIWQKSS